MAKIGGGKEVRKQSRETERGQMDAPTAGLHREFQSQVDKHRGDCQVTRLQAF